MADNYQVRDREFLNDFRDLLQRLFITGDHSDITLVSDDMVAFKAHKLVLYSQSDKIKKILNFLPESDPVLFLKGINSMEIKHLLEFLYLGKVELSEAEKFKLMILAKSFCININFESQEIDSQCFKLENVANDAENSDDLFWQVESEKVIKGNFGKESVQRRLEFFNESNDKRQNQTLQTIPTCQDRVQESKNLSTETNDTITLDENFKIEDMVHEINEHSKINLKHGKKEIDDRFPKQKKLYVCQQCNFESIHRGSYHRHTKGHEMKIEDEGFPKLVTKLLECKQCDFKTAHRNSLRKHTNNHKGIKYKCNDCDHEASDKSNLAKHMSIHLNETSICQNCNKELKNIGSRYSHQCERSYCDLCEMSFTSKSSLSRHIKVQHEGFKYSCSKCDYKAGQTTHLKSHMRLKHSEAGILLSVPH